MRYKVTRYYPAPSIKHSEAKSV